MSSEVSYISYDTAVAVNEAMVNAFGGVAGVRDRGLILA
jgi:hypothetical protein